MDYSKEDLTKEAIKRLDATDDILTDCQELIREIYAEKHVVRHLLWLSCEKVQKE